MRLVKVEDLRKEIEIISQNHEREVDRKDAIIQVHPACDRTHPACNRTHHRCSTSTSRVTYSSLITTHHSLLTTYYSLLTTHQMLDRDLEDSEEQYQMALRSHLLVVDRLIDLHNAKIRRATLPPPYLPCHPFHPLPPPHLRCHPFRTPATPSIPSHPFHPTLQGHRV
tara:strand:- start:1226 stop:1729 length:504 start_codon:yes stop_codon:yes gene_type:complete